jgi:hypothetical protein
MRSDGLPQTGRWRMVAVLALAAPFALVACGSDSPAAPLEEVGLPAVAAPARDQLAALAAAAQDRHVAAQYTLSTGEGPDRAVAVTRATDGTWRVDIPGGALGGTADVSIARTGDGLFQCALALPPPLEPTGQPKDPTGQPTDQAGQPTDQAGQPTDQAGQPTDPTGQATDQAGQPAGAPPDLPSGPTCVRVAGPDGMLPGFVDPRVQHPFTDWLGVLTDRRAPLSVSTVEAPAGVGGACFAVESTSASLSAPLDVGVYCFDPAGTLTGARLGLGNLVLAGPPAPGPPTVTLAGPVVAGSPLGVAAPPTPTTSAS